MVTSRPANTRSCSRPPSNDDSLPTSAIMRRTPGEYCVSATSSSRSKGNCPLVASAAKVIGPFDLDLAEHGQHFLGPTAALTGTAAAVAGGFRRGLQGRRQQLLEQLCAGLAPRRSRGRLQRFQIPAMILAPGGEDHRQQLFYFLGDFLLDRRGRFFPRAASDAACCSSSSTGRRRQIFSFASTKARLHC